MKGNKRAAPLHDPEDGDPGSFLEATEGDVPAGDPIESTQHAGREPIWAAGRPVAPGPAGATFRLPARMAVPTIPGYEILGELGRGGMGIVYRARNIRLNRPCAIKMILAGAHANAATTLRFLAEAEAVARLTHPNIVQIFHTGAADGLPFFELELLPGGSLDRRIDGTPWPWRRAIRLVASLALGVAEAHKLGILHRDLKPSNVLLDGEGTPKIADFGLAKDMAVDAGLTRTDAILGSPSYMAPEQAGGASNRVGAAADIYSLGSILYELLTGRPAFKAATVFETIEQVRTDEPVAPSRLVPGLSRDLETIVLKCLQKDPGRRYGSAAALVEDLRRVEAGEAILARRTSPAGRAWRWCRRNPTLASLAALAASLVLAVAVISSVAAALFLRQRDSARVAASALEVERRNAREAEAVAKVERDRSGKLLFVSDVRLAQQIWDSADGTARAVAGLLGQHVPSRPGEADLRDFAWRFEWTRLHHSAATLRSTPPGLLGALTPDGRPITLDGVGMLRSWDRATGRASVERIAVDGRPPLCCAIAPGGDVVAWGDAGGAALRLFEARGGREWRVIAGPGPIKGVVFSPDGRFVAALWGDRRARVYDATSGEERGSAALLEGPHRCLGLAADGMTLSVGNHPKPGVVVAYDLRTGASAAMVGHGGTVLAVACSPGGRVATGGTFGRVMAWDLASRKPIGDMLQVITGTIDKLAYSADGRRLAVGAEDGLVAVWDVVEGERLGLFKGHTEPILWLAFDGDAGSLASGDVGGAIKVWDLDSPDGVRPLPGTSDGATRLAFAPDGRELIAVGRSIRSLGPRSGLPNWAIDGEDRDPQARVAKTCLALSSDGCLMATGDRSSVVVVRDPANGRPLRELEGVPAAFYGPDSPTLAMGTAEFKRSVSSLAFSPDGAILAAGYGLTTGSIEFYPQLIKLWDPRSGRPLATLRVANSVSSLHFSADGKTLRATSHDGILRSWKVGSWEESGPLDTGAGILSAATTPDGTLLASGLFDGTIVARDLATGRQVLRASGHPGWVVGVAFSPDGRTLASLGLMDRTLKFWDVATGHELMSVKLKEPASDLAFDPAGDRLLIGSKGGVRVLRAMPLDQIDAELAAGRDRAR